jgi:DoxX-like protein
MTQIKKMKNVKIIYWIGLAILSVSFLISGFFEVTKNPAVWDKTLRMGYPDYFIILLGYAKIVGVAALWLPKKFSAIKEWVFAGLVFDVVFAFRSGFEMGYASDFIRAIIFFAIIAVTYKMFRKINPILNPVI